MVVESHGQQEMEIDIDVSRRRDFSEEDNSRFPTFLFQRGQQAETFLGFLLGIEGKILYKSR